MVPNREICSSGAYFLLSVQQGRASSMESLWGGRAQVAGHTPTEDKFERRNTRPDVLKHFLLYILLVLEAESLVSTPDVAHNCGWQLHTQRLRSRQLLLLANLRHKAQPKTSILCLVVLFERAWSAVSMQLHWARMCIMH